MLPARHCLDKLTNMCLPRADAIDLIAFAASVPYRDAASNLGHILIKESIFNDILAHLDTHEPVAYITGRKEFYGLEFEVNRHTLIPRPDTETLINAALQDADLKAPLRLLDLCTGSGCIMLTLLTYMPNATGIGLDIDPQAVTMAQRNALKLGLDGRVQFRVADVLKLPLPTPVDILTMNPPYLMDSEYDNAASSLRFEPRSALVADDDGYIFYNSLLNTLHNLGNNIPLTYFEIGYTQRRRVEEEAKRYGFQTKTYTDLAGHDRVVKITPSLRGTK